MVTDGEPMVTLSVPMVKCGFPIREPLTNGQGPVLEIVMEEEGCFESEKKRTNDTSFGQGMLG